MRLERSDTVLLPPAAPGAEKHTSAYRTYAMTPAGTELQRVARLGDVEQVRKLLQTAEKSRFLAVEIFKAISSASVGMRAERDEVSEYITIIQMLATYGVRG